MKWVTVDDMYNNAKADSEKLLSAFNADFWADYTNNYTYYDRLFRRMFSCFRFFDQKPINNTDVLTDEQIEEVRLDFTDAVYDHLLVNSKKYSELYRVSQLTSEQYPITNNYDITETKEEDIDRSGSNISGARSDTKGDTFGSYEDGVTNTHGMNTINVSEMYGARSDSHSNTQGSQSNSRNTGIAGFNSSDYSNDANMAETLGSRVDSGTDTTGAQDNEIYTVNSAYTDTSTESHGQRTVTTNETKGQQTDTFDHSINDSYTLRKVGNIGVKTVSEMLGEHIELWNTYEFYKYIFKEICADLLLI